MKRLTRYTAPLLLLCGLLSGTTARAEFDWQAKYAGDFISGQSSARLLALGGAGVAIANGPSAVLANPALMGTSTRNALSLMHADRFESAVKVDHAAYVRNAGDGRTLGFGIVRQGVDDIYVTALRDPSQPIGPQNRPYAATSTSASQYAFQFAYASQRPYGLVGGSAKLLYERLYTTDAVGLGIDLGYARSFGDLMLGAQLRDAVTTLVAWEGGRQEAIKPSLRIGGAYSIALERMNARVMPVVELETRTEALGTEDAFAWHGGLEYTIRNTVSARVGYDDGRLTYGAGLEIGPVAVQYAFVGHDDLGATHRISLACRWGRNRRWRRGARRP